MTYDEQDSSYPQAVPAFGVKSVGRYTPIGQGFLVKGTAGTVVSLAQIYTRNSHRVFAKESDENRFFFRNNINEDSEADTEVPSDNQYQENGFSLVPDDFKRFRINVDFTVKATQYTRQRVLNFHDSATAEFDYGLELIRSENSDSDAYFTLDEKIYPGQAFPFEESLVIPLATAIKPLRAFYPKFK